MARKSGGSIARLILPGALLTFGAPVAHAQAQPTDPAGVVGAPFSGVATQRVTRQTLDGNRFVFTSTTRYYRDSRGRTRIERELPAPPAVGNPTPERVTIQINDPVSGVTYILDPQSKTLNVLKGNLAQRPIQPPVPAPPFSIIFAGTTIGPMERGWSNPVSLGEKTMDGIRALGNRREYAVAAGAMRNEKPIAITVEQWFSPELGVMLVKSVHASTGGEVTYRLDDIVQAEPDAALFTAPSNYTQRGRDELAPDQVVRNK
jgi:hypothetical protein